MTARMRWFSLVTSFALLVIVVTLTSWQVSKIESVLNADACRFAAVELAQSNRQIDLLLDAGVYTSQQAADARNDADNIVEVLCPQGVQR